MRDRSDAIADWPLLNALLNTAAGADLVAVHNGGGVGIGYSTHAGALVVCDGTEDADRRIGRVLTTDPGWASCDTLTPDTRKRSASRKTTTSECRPSSER